MHPMKTTAVALIGLLSTSAAMPAPQTGWDPCDPNQSSSSATYSITSQSSVPGTPYQGAQACTGCTLQVSETYSVGWTVTIGEDLSIDITDVISAGVSYSVSESTTTASTEGVSQSCSGPWTCALVVTPQFAAVGGTQETSSSCGGSDSSSNPYAVNIPMTDAAGNSDAYVTTCACTNFPNSSDPGAPAPCPSACPTPA